MAQNSFDVVSTVDLQEVKNAVNQAAREVATRYDLKTSDTKIDLSDEDMVLESADEYTLGQALDVLQTKLVRRGVDLKSLRYGKAEDAAGGRSRQKVEIQQGIPQETAKKIVAEIKKMKNKVQAAIQGDSVRVSSAKRDTLQEVIAHLKTLDLDVPLTFTNYR